MQFAELASVKHRIRLGAPLPFNVRNADHTLLLARGQQVVDEAQLDNLFQRGALVDLAELMSPRDEVMKATRGELPQLWSRSLERLERALMQPEAASFREALDEAAGPVQALIERDPDLAIFHVLQQNGHPDVAYGVQRAMQAGITAFLVAQRLGWSPDEGARVLKVGLTMNLSMLALQGQLSRQTTPLTDSQRGDLQMHPMRSVRLLELAGVTDQDWLRGVLQHHENEEGTGYPSGTTEVCPMASLARRADIYTSKLASRSHREAITADLAGRQMFMQDPGHPMTAALVKEFGIYPPGTYVRLASGAIGMVCARGEVITAPVVTCLTTPGGSVLARPLRVNTSDKAFAIAGVLGQSQVSVRLPLDRLAALVIA